MVGVGTQVLVIALCVFMLSLVGMFYPYNRGAMLSACVVLYALTAGISGAYMWPRAPQLQPAQSVLGALLTPQRAVAAAAGLCASRQLQHEG
jgi:hypothetical protein